MYTTNIIIATIANTTIAHIIPTIIPDDASSDESTVVIFLVNESKKACNTFVEVKFSISSDSNSNNRLSQQMNIIHHLWHSSLNYVALFIVFDV